MRRINTLVFHTTATPGDQDIGSDDVRDYHVNVLGWQDNGYHAVIRKNGAVEWGRPESRPGAGIKGPEPHVYNIAMAGHGDLSDFTSAQKASLARLAADKVEQHEDLTVERCIGHREAEDYGFPRQYKTCPGNKVDCDEIRELIARELRARSVGDTEPAPPPDIDRVAIAEAFSQLKDLVIATEELVRQETNKG